MLDPADCGPAFLALCQDAQGEAYDYPERFFEPQRHEIRRQRPDRREIAAALALLRQAKRPLILAGGGVHYAGAGERLAAFAAKHRIPVAETIAGRGVLRHEHPMNAGPLGVIGSASANALAGEADVVLAIGTRLQDFTTGSWTVFRRRCQAHRRQCRALRCGEASGTGVVGDADEAWPISRRGWRLCGAGDLEPPGGLALCRVEHGDRHAYKGEQHRSAELCPGRGRRQPPGGRKDRVLTARAACPGAHQELEGEIAGDLRLRVRLLLHGL